MRTPFESTLSEEVRTFMTNTVKWIAVPSVVGLLAIGLFAQQSTTPGSLDRRLTGSFENATLKDVLKWLSQQGVSFVARADADGNARLSLSIQDQPIQDVMDAIASAFDTQWEKKGNTYILKQSPRVIVEGVPLRDLAPIPGTKRIEELVLPPGLKSLEGFEVLPPQVFGEEFKEGVPLPPMFFEKSGEQDPKAKAEWERYAKEAEKRAKEFEKKFSDPKFKAEMERHMKDAEKWSREAEKQAKELEKKFDDPKFKAEMERHMKDAEKWSREAEKQAKEFEKKFNDPKFKAEMEKRAAELEKKLADPKFREGMRTEVFVAPEIGELKSLERLKDSGRLRVFTSTPIKKLIETITKAQWEKHAKQGHLKYADLTPAQKEMVKGFVDGGSWNFSFVLDGKKFNLRSK